jgi:sarcosine oxidase subunit gamma
LNEEEASMNAPVKSFTAVKIAVLPPVARLNLRIAPANLASASAAFGLPLPTKIGQGVARNGHAAWCLGPDDNLGP